MKKQIITLVFSIVVATMAQAQLKVTSEGKVGITTTTPQAALDLGTAKYAGPKTPLFLMYNSENSPLGGTKMGFYADYFPGGNNLNLVFPEVATAPGLFTICGKNTGNTTFNRYFNIAGMTGNVGIGVDPSTTVGEKLVVGGNTRFGGKMVWNSWTNVTLDWSMPGGYPVLYGDNNNFYIGKPTNVVNHIWAASIDAATITYTNACYKVSDKRFKKNIKGLSNMLSKLDKINSYSYDYNETFSKVYPNEAKKISKNNQIGFIAQELQNVFPELVVSDSSGYLKIDYISMIPIMLEAMKEQNKTINDLTKQVADVQSCCKGTSKTKSYVESTNETTNPQTLTPNTSSLNTTTKLYQNAPNPFKESTTIKLEIPETVGNAMVCIYDLTGHQLKCLSVSGRGTTSVQIFGNELTAGLYHYALIADGTLVDTKTMVLTE